jgi:hypothetical protein
MFCVVTPNACVGKAFHIHPSGRRTCFCAQEEVRRANADRVKAQHATGQVRSRDQTAHLRPPPPPPPPLYGTSAPAPPASSTLSMSPAWLLYCLVLLAADLLDLTTSPRRRFSSGRRSCKCTHTTETTEHRQHASAQISADTPVCC